MKTKITFTSIIFLILFVLSGVASTPTLTFYGIKGAVVEIPVKLEEATDSIPYEIAESYNEIKKEERKRLVNRQFDLRNMSKPETDLDDVVPANFYDGIGCVKAW
jgi:hypothetical protein